jgi:1-pyrroline-5-carboxylate dehydrogenase
MSAPFKVTYASLSADNEELHGRLDAAISKVKGKLGQGTGDLVSRSPLDTEMVIGRVAPSTLEEVSAAIATARRAFPAWRARPWEERCDVVSRAAALIRERSAELTAWLILEMGKNRVEALGEIEETADLYEYYAGQMRQHGGFVAPMAKLSPADENTSVLRPYGVWAVIAPWNFPYALLGAPIAAALVAGNTVVCKASEETPISGERIVEIFHAAGVPREALQLVRGDGAIGEALAQGGVDGLTFTGSYDVGFHKIFRHFSPEYPKPCIVEMGGKNPAIVMPSADLDRAAMGIFRSAFGMAGQKCSACSRVYAHESIHDELSHRLAAMAKDTILGDPLDRRTFLGPVGTEGNFCDFQRYARMAKEDGRVITGGELAAEGNLARGYYVRPTVVTDLPRDHHLVRQELFVPLVCVERVRDLDEALGLANDTPFGLTAGFFSRVEAEIDTFLDRIEAGVVYVNRAAGATTGAWPGVQPFGGWKGSGSTGKNIGGLYTVQTYLREQSRTITG